MPVVEISTDPSRLDIGVIHEFLSTCYWSEGIPRELVERAIAGSLNFGIFVDGAQAGFARVVTDRTTFAWICDVFVLERYRGQGLSKRLMAAIQNHGELQRLRRRVWSLATRTASTNNSPSPRLPRRTVTWKSPARESTGGLDPKKSIASYAVSRCALYPTGADRHYSKRPLPHAISPHRYPKLLISRVFPLGPEYARQTSQCPGQP